MRCGRLSVRLYCSLLQMEESEIWTTTTKQTGQEVDDSDFHRPSDIPSRLGGCETPAYCWIYYSSITTSWITMTQTIRTIFVSTSSVFSDQLDRRHWSFRLFISSASKKTPGTCLRAVRAHGKTITFFFPLSAVEKLVQLPARPHGRGWTAHSLAGRLRGCLLKRFVTPFFFFFCTATAKTLSDAERELLRSLWKRMAEVPDNHAQDFRWGKKKSVDFSVFRG